MDVKRPPQVLAVPDPAPVEMLELEWSIVEVDGEVYAALTIQGYQNLALNSAELLRWIREARWRLKYYRDNLLKLEEPPREVPDGNEPE